jgi:hypothetical protein
MGNMPEGLTRKVEEEEEEKEEGVFLYICMYGTTEFRTVVLIAGNSTACRNQRGLRN